jgi:hypothetical protein
MTRGYRPGSNYVLIGGYLLVVAGFLSLAIHQAIRLVSLYRVSADPSSRVGVSRLQRLSVGVGDDVLILAFVAAVLFILVFRHPRRLLPISIIAALVFFGLTLYSGRHVLPQLLIQPSPVSLSEQYVEALTAEDLEAALRLTDGSDVCETIMVQVFQDHQARLTQSLGAKRRQSDIQGTNVMSIRTFYDKPVPQGFVLMQPVPTNLATLMVETKNGGVIWLSLKMSYQPFLGGRYICGKGIDGE